MTALPTDPPAAVRTPPAGRPPGPDPARLAGLLARTWLEVRAGRRPLAQLSPLVTPAVRRRLSAQLRRQDHTTVRDPARVRRVVVRTPVDGACEAVVLVERDGRTSAIAVRLERRRGAWRAVELTAPEDGLPALLAPPLLHGPPPDAFEVAAAEAI